MTINRSSGRVPAACPPNFSARYTVRPGDTMFFIAQRFGVSLNALIAANPHISNPSIIFPGDVLCVPGPAPTPPPRIPATCPPGFQGRYTVQPGDTMFFIAQTFGVSLNALIAANPHIPNPNVIFPGDVLCVPGLPPVTLPCCLILPRRIPGLPPGATGVALVQLVTPTQGSVSIVATALPEPEIFGNFDTYAGQINFPPPDGSLVFALARVPEPPAQLPTWSGTVVFPVPPIPILTGQTVIEVRPFNTATGAIGPAIIFNSLDRCCQ